MTATAVVELLRMFEAEGVSPWVDGGWGVDALLGYQSRPHADLDIVIPRSTVSTAREVLTTAGFTVVRDWLPTALAMRHEDGVEVDLHPVTPTEDGGGNQQLLPPKPPFHYDAPTTGLIDGTQVTCVDAATPGTPSRSTGWCPDVGVANLRRGCHAPPMLWIIIIVVLIVLLLGGFGFSRRGR